MKIVSPINHPDEVKALVEAGAEEFYCGFIPPEWTEKYGYHIPLNRRPNQGIQNIRSFEDFSRIIERAHNLNASVDVTLNALYYVEEQYSLLIPFIKKLSALGVDAFIIADLGLLMTIKQMDLPQKIKMSGEGTAQNVQTANFYKELGISQIIFPRQVTVDEIRYIVSHVPGVEYEVYILNERCRFCDGLCTPTHGVVYSLTTPPSTPLTGTSPTSIPAEGVMKSPNFCDSLHFMQRVFKLRNSGFLPIEEELKLKISAVYDSLDDRDYDPKLRWGASCGCCAIKEFMDIGINALKIVGRGAPLSFKIEWIKTVKEAIDLAAKHDSYESFRQALIELKGDKDRCKLGVRCYYPSSK